MLIRLALESDFDEIVAMARENVETTRPEAGFDEYEVRESLYVSYLDAADITVFVAETKTRELAGFLVCGMSGYLWASGLHAIQEVLYVKPRFRGSRAAVMLMKELIQWARGLNAKEIVGGCDNGFQPDRMQRFMEHFGFKNVGCHMRLEL